MTELTVKEITELGMGMTSFIVLIILLWKGFPVLNRLDKQTAALIAQNQDVIRNNTSAMQEQARANENVASALKMISLSNTTVGECLERHDKRAEEMMIDMVKIRADVSHLIKK